MIYISRIIQPMFSLLPSLELLMRDFNYSFFPLFFFSIPYCNFLRTFSVTSFIFICLPKLFCTYLNLFAIRSTSMHLLCLFTFCTFFSHCSLFISSIRRISIDSRQKSLHPPIHPSTHLFLSDYSPQNSQIQAVRGVINHSLCSI